MIPVEAALAHVLGLITPLVPEEIPLIEAAGRVLARPVAARRDQPPFDASSMDGYALKRADFRPGARLRVVGEAGAGHAFTGQLGTGEAARIFTGAPLPEGADCVVIQEDVTRSENWITLGAAPGQDRYIRPRGSDFRAGDSLPAPRRLSPADLALLAAMNIARVPVTRRPEVAIIATGDELVMPGDAPRPDQIIAANGFALHALIEAAGGKPRLLPIARDNEAALGAVLDQAKGADLIVTIGGASVGDHDLVAQVLRARGMELAFHRIAMRPGKPLLAGRLGGVPVLGLPGNPVSAIVCAHLFVLPALKALLGLGSEVRLLTARLAVDVGPNGPRAHYMRARLIPAPGQTLIDPFPNQDSALLRVLSEADALLLRPIGDGPRQAGEAVPYLPLRP